MANPTLSDLKQVNQLILDIDTLEKKLGDIVQEVSDLRHKHLSDLDSYKERQVSIEIESRNRSKINERLNELKSEEIKLFNSLQKSLHSKIEAFLNSSSFGSYLQDLVTKLQKTDKDVQVLADPALAQKLGLKDTKTTDVGKLRVVTGVKTYILDPAPLLELVQQDLLQQTLAA